MAERTTKGSIPMKKVAIVQLDQPEGLESVEGNEEAEIEVENWPEDGNDNIIPIGKPFQCSIHLANRLKNAGRIKRYTITSVPIDR